MCTSGCAAEAGWQETDQAWPSPCHDKAMRAKRFGARIAADPRGHAVIAVPFDPDEAWGAKAQHHVNGTVNGCRVRVTIAPGDSGIGQQSFAGPGRSVNMEHGLAADAAVQQGVDRRP